MHADIGHNPAYQRPFRQGMSTGDEHVAKETMIGGGWPDESGHPRMEGRTGPTALRTSSSRIVGLYTT